MAESVVLDTSACFALLEDEGGADVVEELLVEARSGRAEIHGSFVTLTEVEYITLQERGEEDAARALATLKAWPVNWHHSNDAVCSAAAKLKAVHQVSFADSFVASLAQDLDATLIHKDPEFLALNATLKQKMLPPK